MMLPFSDDPTLDFQSAEIIRMAELIAKEQLGDLTADEEEALDHWLKKRDIHRVWREKLVDSAYLAGLFDQQQLAAGYVESSLKKFHMEYMSGASVYVMHKAVWKRWLRVVAAVLLPFLLVGVWTVVRHDKAMPVAERKSTPILPEGNRATLLLANGERVVLDSSGRLIQSDSVGVNYNDGQVTYEAKELAANQVSYNTLSTAKGGLYRLVLPDGTKVWLNAVSSLKYPTAFVGKVRHVELTGQAYFEVSARKDQPFTVGVDGMNITVLGTEFDVMAYPDEGRKLTTVAGGAVQVESGSDVKRLIVGERAIAEANKSIAVTRDVDVEAATAWKTGFFQFSHTDIKTLMREVSRWYDIEIVYERKDLSGEYGGRISRRLELADLLKLLEGIGIGHFRMEGRKLVVLP